MKKRSSILILTVTIFPLLASQELKIEEIVNHKTTQQKEDITIEENLHGGKVLVLSDGSTWEVAPQDVKISQTWIFPVPLKIEKSTNNSYSYKMTNTNSNSSVLVRPITNHQQF